MINVGVILNCVIIKVGISLLIYAPSKSCLTQSSQIWYDP